MLYKDWQYPNTYLVSLKQLKQKLRIAKKWKSESFPSCLYFTTTIIPMHPIQFFLLEGIVTPRLGPNVLTLHVLYDLLKTWWVEQWSHVKDIWVCIRCIIVAVLCVKCLFAWRGPWAETQSQPPLPLIPHILLSSWLGLQCFCVVWWQACVPWEGHPPTCTPTLWYQAAFPSLFWHLPASVGTSLSDLRYLSRLSVDYEDPLTRLLSVSLCIMSSSSLLWLFIHSNFFPSFQFVVFVSLFPCFILFSVLPKLPSGTPVFPLKDAFQLSSPPLSLLMGRAGDNLLYLFIYLVRAEVVPACISLYLRV